MPQPALRSMTGFATSSFEDDQWSLRIEIRSLNHKYFNWSFQASQEWLPLEPELQKRAQSTVHRGDLRVFVRTRYFNPELFETTVQLGLLRNILEQLAELSDSSHGLSPQIHLDGLLGLPGMVSIGIRNETVRERFREIFLSTFDSTLKDLIRYREVEGLSLWESMRQALDELDALTSEIYQGWDDYMRGLNSRFQNEVLSKFALLEKTTDESRIWSEIALWIQKADAREEIDRLMHHSRVFRQTLEEPKCGKKLEFIAQEMFREAQTLSAKWVGLDYRDHLLRIKTLIDRMREQIQNVE